MSCPIVVALSDSSQVSGILSPIVSDYEVNDISIILHDIFVSLTNIDATLVRENYQPEGNPMPKEGTNWMSFYIKQTDTQGISPIQTMTDLGLEISTPQELTVLVTMYGPKRWASSQRLRASLNLSQNRDYLTDHGLSFLSQTEENNTSILVQNKWVKVINFKMKLRRMVTTLYNVKALGSATFELNGIQYTV